MYRDQAGKVVPPEEWDEPPQSMYLNQLQEEGRAWAKKLYMVRNDFKCRGDLPDDEKRKWIWDPAEAAARWRRHSNGRQGNMQIFVKFVTQRELGAKLRFHSGAVVPLSGYTIVLDVNLGDTVRSVRNQIAQKTGFPSHYTLTLPYRFLLPGGQAVLSDPIENDFTLAQVGVYQEDTLRYDVTQIIGNPRYGFLPSPTDASG